MDIIAIPQSTEEIKLEASAREIWAHHNKIMAVEVLDDAMASQATDLIKAISVTKKKIDGERKEILKPFKDGVEKLNARFKTLTDPLDMADSAIRQKLDAFLAEKRRKADEERRRIEAERAEAERKAAEERAKDAPDAPPPAPPVSAPVAPPAPRSAPSTQGNFAAASTRKGYDYVVLNLEAFAAAYPEYITLKDGDIKRHLAATKGAPMDGLKINETETLVVR